MNSDAENRPPLIAVPELSLRKPSAILVWLYCAAVLFGAALMFVLEPLAGKIVVPKFGGTAGVWSVCLLFFQLVVLVGYGITYGLSKLSLKFQIGIYLCLAAGSLFWSHIPTGEAWNCNDFANPAIPLLTCLLRFLFLPSLFLATISGMMQIWFRRARLGDPYPLYSLSNIGSLSALLLYPLVLEPNFSVSETLWGWQKVYLLVGTVIVICGLHLAKDGSSAVTDRQAPSGDASKTSIKARQFLWWTSLAAVASLALLCYTSHITADVAPLPLLWVLPLTIYLLSFVLVFSGRKFYKRQLYAPVWIPIAFFECYYGAFERLNDFFGFQLALAVNLALVFCISMLCHGELAESKPAAESLPVFYFALALGGLLGGVFANFVAPAIFQYDAERAIVMLGMAIITFQLARSHAAFKNPGLMYPLFVMGLIGIFFSFWSLYRGEGIVHRQRNFYSCVKVLDWSGQRFFVHGGIIHGQQSLTEQLAQKPLGNYWPPFTLIDQFVRSRKNGPLCYGDIGLGVGVLAAYGKQGDEIQFYELDPKVKDIAEKFFTFISKSQALVTVRLGDGRALLALEPTADKGKFDVLLVDAFNGDAIPCHLLTSQALDSYLRHLKSDGLLVFHVTNKYVTLSQLLASTGKKLGLHACQIQGEGRVNYVVLSKDKQLIHDLVAYGEKRSDLTVAQLVPDASVRGWTDDYINLLSVLK